MIFKSHRSPAIDYLPWGFKALKAFHTLTANNNTWTQIKWLSTKVVLFLTSLQNLVAIYHILSLLKVPSSGPITSSFLTTIGLQLTSPRSVLSALR